VENITEQQTIMTKKALIIGAGPSIEKNLEDIKRLGKFPGMVICTDGGINKTLTTGLIPDWVSSLEDSIDLDKYYITDIVKEKGHLVKNAIISDRVTDRTRLAMQNAGMKWNVAGKLRGYITSNVGLFSWLGAVIIWGCDEIYMVGMDHCYGKGQLPNVDLKSDLFKYGFKTMDNTINGEHLILHPAFQLWKEEFEWYKAKYPEIKTFNCTGRGALFRKDFLWKPISEMKSW